MQKKPRGPWRTRRNNMPTPAVDSTFAYKNMVLCPLPILPQCLQCSTHCPSIYIQSTLCLCMELCLPTVLHTLSALRWLYTPATMDNLSHCAHCLSPLRPPSTMSIVVVSSILIYVSNLNSNNRAKSESSYHNTLITIADLGKFCSLCEMKKESSTLIALFVLIFNCQFELFLTIVNLGQIIVNDSV